VVIWYIFPRFGMLRQKNLANLNTLDWNFDFQSNRDNHIGV
jgi:hypothetical protein